jgi:WD40 repeat protein
MNRIETGENLATLTGRGNSVLAVVFSPDGRLLASSSRYGTIREWAVR